MQSARYHTDAIVFLGLGANSYTNTGKVIPTEFTHGVSPLYSKMKNLIDFNSYHFTNTPEGDWSGAHNTFFDGGLAAALYAKQLGIDPGFNLADFAAKRNIFYQGINSDYVKYPPPSISSASSHTSLMPYIDNVTSSPGYYWWLNAISSDMYTASTLLQYYINP
jgi:hypothetical protein